MELTPVPNPFSKVLNFLEKLEETNIWYRLEHVRDSIMVILAIPGQRWEVEFFDDGHVEVERFVSAGPLEDEAALTLLWSLIREP